MKSPSSMKAQDLVSATTLPPILALMSRVLRRMWLFATMLLVLGGPVLAQVAPPSDLIPIRIAWIPGSPYRLPVAAAKDLFRKHGLDAEMIRFTSGPAMNAAYKSGAVDISVSGPPGVLTIMSTGVRLKVFLLENETADSNGLIVQPDSGIHSIADLKGKSVAMPQGTVVWVAFFRALKKHGIDLKDVKVLDMGVVPAVAAFKARQVPAAWVWSQAMYELVDSGGKEIARDRDFGSGPNFWVGRADWVNKNPEAIQRFFRAMQEAELFYKDDPVEATKLYAKQFNISESIATRMLTQTKTFGFQEQLALSGPSLLASKTNGAESILADFARTLNANGFLRTIPDLTNVVDSSHVERFLKRSPK